MVDLSDTAVEKLLQGGHPDPFAVLGMHRGETGLVVRMLLPDARAVVVVDRDGGRRFAAEKCHPDGLFRACLNGVEEFFPYALEVETLQGAAQVRRDPYSFGPLLGADDQYLFNEGTYRRAYRQLGAHCRCIDAVDGVYFAVWAPNAGGVNLVGDFNAWDNRVHPMRNLGSSGLWELFVPHARAGARYKYEIRPQQGTAFLKADPFARSAEVPPATASIVADPTPFSWGDEAWMERRAVAQLTDPMAIYELHLTSWRRGDESLGYRELAQEIVAHVVDLGFTHIEVMPVAEHPFDLSWGYQVTGYFAPTSRLGPPADFAYFVDYCHCNDIGVIVDWVPGHFPADAHGLARFDGTALYEHEDPRQGLHPDWETLIFNYGRPEVRSFLLSNALFWLDHYHVDGLRVDAVASMLYLDYSRDEGEWIPNRDGGRENLQAVDFLRQVNTAVYGECPGAITIAEESTSWPQVSQPVELGGLGFGYKWNMGWMNDVLSYMAEDPVHRKYHHNQLTFGLLYAFSENFILPLSHDEVVHGKGSLLGKMPGDPWQQRANLRLLYGFMYGHPGKKLLFMGAELAQPGEWQVRESLDWSLLQQPEHRGIYRFVADLNRLYRGLPALHQSDFVPEGFAWLDCQDVEQSVLAFIRRPLESGPGAVFVFNFTPVPRHAYGLGVPQVGVYREVLNSDAGIYGGTDVGNMGAVKTVAEPMHGHDQSLRLELPPLGLVVLQSPDY
ncbi:MAG: 1,4-alpha-glucan branching protein GlgB [Candidatus Latescibacteria bacterium]|nr:1,4-alpha-glucan branching protein GlgB [Candidatus Latescibacterota bacterium]